MIAGDIQANWALAQGWSSVWIGDGTQASGRLCQCKLALWPVLHVDRQDGHPAHDLPNARVPTNGRPPATARTRTAQAQPAPRDRDAPCQARLHGEPDPVPEAPATLLRIEPVPCQCACVHWRVTTCVCQPAATHVRRPTASHVPPT